MFGLVINQIREEFLKEKPNPRGIYFSLYESVRKLIEGKSLPGQTLLPPTRHLAESLNLSRSTVVKAYNLLAENQLIVPRQGSGFKVKTQSENPVPQVVGQFQYPEISESGKAFLQNSQSLTSSHEEGLAFTPGLPPVDIFPIHQWQKLTNLYWRTIRSADLNYSVSSGIGSLKKSIADYLLLSRRIHCTPEQVIVVSGSLQSLFLLGTVLIDRGDSVYVENPTFPNVISIFKSLQARIEPVGLDEEGILVEQMEGEKKEKVKLVHVTPSNQYPLGGKMSRNRRMELIRWASENQSYIIENDYEHEINNRKDPEEAIFSLDTECRTIYLSTFNRILHPSIRLGYMVVPHHLLPAVKALQSHSHRFVPQSIQVVMTEFINQGLMYKHIRLAIEEASDRKQAFEQQFCKLMPEKVTLAPMQTPSFHLVAYLPDEADDQQICARLEKKSVFTHPLSKCYLGSPARKGLILGYSSVNKAFMTQVLARMAKYLSGMLEGGK